MSRREPPLPLTCEKQPQSRTSLTRVIESLALPRRKRLQAVLTSMKVFTALNDHSVSASKGIWKYSFSLIRMRRKRDGELFVPFALQHFKECLLGSKFSGALIGPNPTEPFVGGTVVATPTGIDTVRSNAVVRQQVPITATQATPILMLRIKTHPLARQIVRVQMAGPCIQNTSTFISLTPYTLQYLSS